MSDPPAFDVVVVSQAVVELATPEPLRTARRLDRLFFGDALNAAETAAAVGARSLLLTRVADDELGQALVDRVVSLGVDSSLIRRTEAYNDVYIVSYEPSGEASFVYTRRHAELGAASRSLDVAGASAWSGSA